MTLLALGLVLAAGVFHATWNLLAKRVEDGGSAFVWLSDSLSTLIFAPIVVVVIFLYSPVVGVWGFVFMFGTGVLHAGYSLSLQKGYGVGDLSVVYPLARGTGPLLSSALAIVIFGEKLTPLTVLGVVLIAGGVFALAWEPTSESNRSSAKQLAIVYGLLTGSFIAAYTLWDKYAVSELLLSPILYYWASCLVEMVLLAPIGWRKRETVRDIWSAYRLESLGVAVLSPLSYILVLTALVFSPVSHVAPAREIGILIGTAMGGQMLKERNAPRRLLAAGVIVLGVVALAV